MSEDLLSGETFGERLLRLRRERELTQRELAGTGVSVSYICRLEAGERNPSVKAIRELAARLGVSAGYLETGMRDPEEVEAELGDAELELRLGSAEEIEARFSRLLAEADAIGAEVLVVRAQSGLILAYAAKGDHERVVETFESFAGERPLVMDRPDLYGAVAQSYAAAGETLRAAALLRRCIEEISSQEPPDPILFVRFASYLSYALTDLGDRAGAHRVLVEALERADEVEDLYSQVRIYWSLARLAAAEGEVRSVDYMRKAIALLEATEDRFHLGTAHESCASALLDQGRAGEAASHLERAEAIYRELNATGMLGSSGTEWARYHLQQGHDETARSTALHALDLLDEGGSPLRGNVGTAWRTLASVFARLADDELAERAYRVAIEALSDAPVRDLAETYRSFGKFLKSAGRTEEALEMMERAANLAVPAGTWQGSPSTEEPS